MFDIIIGTGHAADFVVVRLEGCPNNGIDCIDFRRQWGFPDDVKPSIDLPCFKWHDEAFVRNHKRRVNNVANITSTGGGISQLHFSKEGVLTSLNLGNTTYNPPYVSPAVAIAYRTEQNEQTAADLVRDLWDYSMRSFCRFLYGNFDLSTHEGRSDAIVTIRKMKLDDLQQIDYPGEEETIARACALADKEKHGE